MADVLLSIKPLYANRILDGSKRFEFRKRMPALDVDRVIIYASAPTCRIVGEFKVVRRHAGTPAELWDRATGHAGIDRLRFFEYFAGRTAAYAFEVGEVKKYRRPIAPRDHQPGFRGPQSFAYFASLSRELEDAIDEQRWDAEMAEVRHG